MSQSLQDKLRARREALFQERTFVLPIPGYEDLLAARYRTLPYEQLRKIGKQNAKAGDTSETELNNFADTLTRACVELLEKQDDDTYRSLGDRWTPQSAVEHFGVQLPENATARDAIRAVLPGNQLALHADRYDDELQKVLPEVGETLAGESAPSPDGTSSLEPQPQLPEPASV